MVIASIAAILAVASGAPSAGDLINATIRRTPTPAVASSSHSAAPATSIPVPAPTVSAPSRTSPKPKASPEFKAYVSKMQDLMKSSTSAGNTLVDRLTEASKNPTLALNPGWKAGVKDALRVFSDTSSQIRSYSPVPKEASRLHTQALEIADDLDYSVTEYTAGIDGLAINRVMNANDRMQTMSGRVERARQEMARLQSEYAW